MNTGHLLLASLALVAGCASQSLSPAAAPAPSEAPAAELVEVDQGSALEAQASPAAAGAATSARDQRQVGDYVTFAFSGAYRGAPLKLTQRVVDRGEGTITVDFTFTEAKKSETLRIKSRPDHGDVIEVTRVAKDGSTSKASVAEFEAKMAQTVAIADENESLIDETATTVRVGQSDIPATKSTYKVRVGQKAGTLETTVSEAFAWGDLGGRIVTSDGKTFFAAELVDAGGPAAARASLE